jgi:hypothetical protein
VAKLCRRELISRISYQTRASSLRDWHAPPIGSVSRKLPGRRMAQTIEQRDA